MRHALLLLTIVYSHYLGAQSILLPLPLVGKYGYVDAAGAWVIPPRFAAAGAFADGLAPVRERGLYGYIDTAGHYAIPPRYDYAEAFEGGLAVAYLDSVGRVIDRQGREMFVASSASGALALVADARLISVPVGPPRIFEQRDLLLYRTDGTLVFPDTVTELAPVGEGHLQLEIKDQAFARDRTRTIIINSDGKVVWRQQNTVDRWDLGRFRDGVMPVGITRASDARSRLGFLDDEGDIEWLTDWSNYRPSDLLTATKGSTINLFDPTSEREALLLPSGKTVGLDPRYELVKSIIGGYGFVQAGRKYYVIDSLGRVDQTTKYEEPSLLVSYRLFPGEPQYLAQRSGGRRGTLGRGGAFEAAPRVVSDSSTHWFADSKDGSIVWLEDRWSRVGWWDLRTQTVVAPRFWRVVPSPQDPSLFVAQHIDTIGYVRRDGSWLAERHGPAAHALDIDYLYPRQLNVPAGRWQAPARTPGLALVPQPDSNTAGTQFFWLSNSVVDSTYYFPTDIDALSARIEASVDSGTTWRAISRRLPGWCGSGWGFGRLGPGQA